MIVRFAAARAALALTLLLPMVCAGHGARADSAAANDCAASLSKDAKTIFDATLPQVAPGADLRSLLTTIAISPVEVKSPGLKRRPLPPVKLREIDEIVEDFPQIPLKIKGFFDRRKLGDFLRQGKVFLD